MPITPSLENWPSGWRYRPDTQAVTARHALVVSTDPYASEVGAEILHVGGNAVDAAVAVHFALAVVNPEAGNVGGGGFLLVRTAAGEEAALDFRSRAPLMATRDMFLDQHGQVGDQGVIGHLAVATPGSVHGMWEAHRRFGTLPWSDLLQPAVTLARGFVVRENFLRSFTAGVVAGLRRFPTSARTFLPKDGPPVVGDRFAQPELEETLARIRDLGPKGFYEGDTAELFVREIESGGGILSRDDLASYRAIWRAPVRFHYRRRTVLSMPPPSSGGVALALMAHTLGAFDVGHLPWHGAGHVHLLAEASKRAYADRNRYLADPDFGPIPLETLTSPVYGAWRAQGIVPSRMTPSADVAPGVEGFIRGRSGSDSAEGVVSSKRPSRSPSGETTHFSIVDASGNAVAVTTTINSWYGSKVTVAGAGFLLNNDMDDFTSKPGVPNQFGLVQGEANAVAPGKRMLSAMTPTIVLDRDDRLSMVLGTPGGATITTTVFQTISNVLDHRLTLAQAVLAPRIHHQHLPDEITYEPGGLPGEVVAALRQLGHQVVERSELSGDVQAILRLPNGSLEGQADPRRGGSAAGY